MPSLKVRRAIKAFEKAVMDKWDRENIRPHYNLNAREQASINALNLTIEHNYIKARAKLERLMENL